MWPQPVGGQECVHVSCKEEKVISRRAVWSHLFTCSVNDTQEELLPSSYPLGQPTPQCKHDALLY